MEIIVDIMNYYYEYGGFLLDVLYDLLIFVVFQLLLIVDFKLLRIICMFNVKIKIILINLYYVFLLYLVIF